jgi:competence protein ComGC
MNSSKDNSGVVGTAVMVFIVLAVLLFMLESGNYMYPAHFKKDGCIAYMKIIESASEMYIMENENKPPASMEELVSKKLLLSIPSCPGATYRRISFLRSTDYDVRSQKPYELIPYQDEKKEFHVDVRCDIHGLLSKQETDDKYTGAPKYAMPR